MILFLCVNIGNCKRDSKRYTFDVFLNSENYVRGVPQQSYNTQPYIRAPLSYETNILETYQDKIICGMVFIKRAEVESSESVNYLFFMSLE